MPFQLDIQLTEEDYVLFNQFYSLKSPQGKQLAKKTQALTVGVCMVCSLVFLSMEGLTIYSWVFFLVMALCAVFYLLNFEAIQKRNIEKLIQRMKKNGRLPYDESSAYTFYEDKFLEVTPLQRIERSYALTERVCVVQDQFILIFISSATACILPMEQVKAQVDTEAFIQFLSEKCAKVEYY